MKTRFTPLIKVKKEMMDRCERDLQKANQAVHNAQSALDDAYRELDNAQTPESGSMTQFKNSRMLITAQREIIKEKQEWLAFALKQVESAKQALKTAMIDYEKFKYLEAEQIKKVLLEQRRKEQRELDEIAVLTFDNVKGSA
ncbi:MAG: flagellar export protein FliJ [Campylobacterota bacterium]|nr:flagellar export protein FliJ [Campylobacterota bacterium]